MREHINTFTDLLMGAAYADKKLEGRELETIRALMERVVATSPLPAEQEARIRSFNPARYDPVAAASTLAFLSNEDKHIVVELVAMVTEADGEIDMAEDDYLRLVAVGLGLSKDEIAGLTLEIIEDDDLDGLLLEIIEDDDLDGVLLKNSEPSS